MALAQDLQVQRQHQRRAAGGLGAVDQVGHELAVAHHVELEPERLPGGFGHVFQRADAHRGQGERHAEIRRGLGRQDFAVGMLHAGQAGGRNRQRHHHVMAHHRGAQRPAFHVHRHALAQLDLVEIAFIGAVGAFGPGAGIGVVVEHARHALLRDDSQIFDAGDRRKVSGHERSEE
ncbi:hypothetical protein D3C78_1400290 [compost metagenome]